MDKRTLKAFIIELKDEDNKSFQDIADILLEEHGIKMSRQAVCGMYKRAYELVAHNKDMILLTNDIVNLSCLGYECKQIKDILSKYKENLTLVEIKRILDENKEYLRDLRKDKAKTVAELLDKGSDINDIKLKLMFKGNLPTDIAISSFIRLGCKQLINYKATEVLAKTFSATEDRDLLREVINSFNLDITFRDIGKELNS